MTNKKKRKIREKWRQKFHSFTFALKEFAKYPDFYIRIYKKKKKLFRRPQILVSSSDAFGVVKMKMKILAVVQQTTNVRKIFVPKNPLTFGMCTVTKNNKHPSMQNVHTVKAEPDKFGMKKSGIEATGVSREVKKNCSKNRQKIHSIVWIFVWVFGVCSSTFSVVYFYLSLTRLSLKGLRGRRFIISDSASS